MDCPSAMLRSGMTREWVDEGMIRSYKELHFGELHNDKKGYGFKETTGELNCSSAYIRLREPGKLEDKVEEANVATKEAKENRIGASPATG
ncbi:hypothetical protein B296_00048769 [Ensete ventricosum]|uniref:Uncharacterized protein n=1 Tax=Ensete ventricosum TaxID=4639 RepID=A0A426YTE5_ENSVE|nr:hypothetical protein B296_00048769 [Ensete ventricosum]